MSTPAPAYEGYCDVCQRATFFAYYVVGHAARCMDCWERRVAWSEGWLAPTDVQRSRIKYVRWLYKQGRLSEGVVSHA